MKEIRPSSLPRLAECPVFEGAEGFSEAASRGTKIDKAIRDIVAGSAMDETLTDEDKEVVRWGALELMALGKGAKVETREEYLAMHIPGISASGTADAVCEKQKWVADIKTGQVRNYREQLAAYALACMDASWDASWTAHVIYVDQRLVRSYEFTREQAERIVQGVVSLATSPLAVPKPCEYCAWCKHRDSCSALVTQSRTAIANVRSVNGDTLEIIRAQLTKDPETTAEFVRRWKFAEKEIAEPVMAQMKESIISGAEYPGWSLSSRQGGEYVELNDLQKIAEKATPLQVALAMGGKASGKQFRELCAMVGVEPDETAIRRGEPITYLRQTKTKTIKEN